MDLKQWDCLAPLSQEEMRRVCPLPFPVKEETYNEEVNRDFLNMCIGKFTEGAQCRVFDSATRVIHTIFDLYARDEDTLVITTYLEHPSVNYASLLCKNHLVVKNRRPIPNSLLRGYKRVLAYLISTSYDGTEDLDFQWVQHLRKQVTDLGIESVFVLDDVQGMFLLERDYTLFDYVVGTAHSLVLPINMGFCINCNTKLPTIGWHNERALKHFIAALHVVLSRKDKMLVFKKVVMEHYAGNPDVRFLPTNPYRVCFVVPSFKREVEEYLKSKFSDLGDIYINEYESSETGQELRIMTRSYTYISGFPLSLETNLKELDSILTVSQEFLDSRNVFDNEKDVPECYKVDDKLKCEFSYNESEGVVTFRISKFDLQQWNSFLQKICTCAKLIDVYHVLKQVSNSAPSLWNCPIEKTFIL